MRVTFEKVALVATKSGKCGCGKRRVRARRFFQTVNPFNLNALGLPKTREEILEELQIAITAWKREPITCHSCEEKQL